MNAAQGELAELTNELCKSVEKYVMILTTAGVQLRGVLLGVTHGIVFIDDYTTGWNLKIAIRHITAWAEIEEDHDADSEDEASEEELAKLFDQYRVPGNHQEPQIARLTRYLENRMEHH